MITRSSKKKILIVDDDKSVVIILKKILKEYDYRIICASTYRQGMRNYKKSLDLKVAIVDLKLDNKHTGLEFIREAKKINNKVKFIIITGYGTEEARKETAVLKVKYFLDKPAIKIKTLLEIINKKC